MSLSRTFTLVALVAGLTLGGCKKNKKGSDLDDDPSLDDMAAQDIRVDISVVAISPSSVPANTARQATVRGAGFERGAMAFVDATSLETEFVNENALTVQLPGLAVGTYDIEVANPGGESSTLRQGLRVDDGGEACASATLYFDLAQSGLRTDAVSVLTTNLDCYARSTATIRIEGHCDERGTTDYNLALGDRRASAVRRWLSSRGIPSSRINVVTYGEERPADPAHSELAWARNRRAEIMLMR